MLQLVRLLRHKHGRPPHNHVSLPFDTLTNVYRDAVHARKVEGIQDKLQQHKENLERQELEKVSVWEQPLPEWRNEVEVTNHVGNLGVMSIYRSQTRSRETTVSNAESETVEGCTEKESEKEIWESNNNKTTNSKHSRTASILSDLQKGNEQIKKVRWHDQEKQINNSNNTSNVRQKSARRLSGVQLEILSLYRHLLKETKRFRDAATRVNMRAHIREEFIKHTNIPRRNIMQIEWQINYAKRKLEDMRHMHANTKFSVMK